MNNSPPEFPGNYPGTIRPVPDLALLTRGASLIVTGDVVAIRPQGSVLYRVHGANEHFEQLSAEVRIGKVLKGRSSNRTLHVDFLRAAAASALVTLASGEHSLLFLARDGRSYRFADIINGKIAISNHAEPYEGATPVARVLSAIAATARDARGDTATQAIVLLRQTSAREAVQHLRRLTETGAPSVRQAAAEALRARADETR